MGWIHQGPKLLQVQVPFAKGSPLALALLQIGKFARGHQPQVAGGQLQAVVAGQHPQQRHGNRRQGFAEEGPVPLAADTIEHHPGDRQAGVMVAEAPHQGGQGTRLATGLHHQHDRQFQLLGHGRRTAFGAGAAAIE